MSAAQASRRAREKLNTLAQAGLDSFAYRERAIGDLRAVLQFDAAWWWTIDPASALFTSGVFEPFPSDHAICGGLHSNEFGDSDYNKFRVMARRTAKAGVLSAATGGDLERSDRYRYMLAPLNYEHELRLALSDESALWGGIALLRKPGTPDFTPAESRHLASLGQPLTEGLRIGIALGAGSVDCTPNGPGMLIVDNDLNILTMTSSAERWLAELADGCPGLPDAVRSVVGYVRQLHDSGSADDRLPRVRVHQGDRRRDSSVAVHRAGSPQGDLRKGRRAIAAGTGRHDLRPVPLAPIRSRGKFPRIRRGDQRDL